MKICTANTLRVGDTVYSIKYKQMGVITFMPSKRVEVDNRGHEYIFIDVRIEDTVAKTTSLDLIHA